MSALAAERCAECGRPFSHPSTYRLVAGRAVCRARKWCEERASRQFADSAIVRVKGTPEQQHALYGREVVGAVGEVRYPYTRSHGMNRYLVRIAAHDYTSPVRGLVSHIEAFDIVLREDHIERVPTMEAETPHDVEDELDSEIFTSWQEAENEAVQAGMLDGEEAPAEAMRTCRGCGCTDEWGCDNGCWWVEADLCSNCVGAPAAIEEVPV